MKEEKPGFWSLLLGIVWGAAMPFVMILILLFILSWSFGS